MSGGDRTGPMSEGPMTGRGFGYCTGGEGPGYEYPGGGWLGRRGRGRGLGAGRGDGFGRGFAWRSRVPRVQRSAAGDPAGIREEIEELKRRLDDLIERLATKSDQSEQG